jgi:hypothetical protein
MFYHNVSNIGNRVCWIGTARGSMIVVRCEDESMFGFQKERVTRQFFTQFSERMNKLGLTLNATKTRLIQFERLEK